MITRILNGKCIYNNMIFNIGDKVEKYFNTYNITPCLSIFLIGNNFSSNLYVKNKIFSCKSVYIKYILFKFSKTVRIKTLILLLNILNKDCHINGILIQKPLPQRLNKLILFKSISFSKDVDLMNPLKISNYMSGFDVGISPCVSQAVFCFLNKLNLNLCGLKVVIFGFSNIVGKPLCYEFVSRGSTVSIINEHDNNFKNLSQYADIFIIAIGSPLFLSKGMISYGSVIIDIGINKIANNKVVGDADISDLLGKVSWITPVPGGIGPVTISYLLLNTLTLFLHQQI